MKHGLFIHRSSNVHKGLAGTLVIEKKTRKLESLIFEKVDLDERLMDTVAI